jgi:hypothetical protein
MVLLMRGSIVTMTYLSYPSLATIHTLRTATQLLIDVGAVLDD